MVAMVAMVVMVVVTVPVTLSSKFNILLGNVMALPFHQNWDMDSPCSALSL
jgi:hypothetical protein